MSLRISNKATPRQVEILAELEYTGRGKYAPENLTNDQASNLIDELFTQKRMTTAQIAQVAGDWYHTDLVEIAGTTPDEYDDPFSNVNKRSI